LEKITEKKKVNRNVLGKGLRESPTNIWENHRKGKLRRGQQRGGQREGEETQGEGSGENPSSGHGVSHTKRNNGTGMKV